MTAAAPVRHCATCYCAEATLRIDTRAPFFGLVMLVDTIVWEQATAKRWQNRDDEAAA